MLERYTQVKSAKLEDPFPGQKKAGVVEKAKTCTEF